MLIFTEEKLQVWCNILIINNAELTIAPDPTRVIGFFGATDFTELLFLKRNFCHNNKLSKSL